ncbi:DUF4258 domain-containing protein [Galbibacter sp. EGI 63066]|uniref:DUF4258 domain-containing protein n=1 Tax=Galbibacter sp. EGI 63066 TaxID=2993559 RepID=UPI0022490E3F|nr:DUF4258 domain-containing protein [Galbibacter sp. EGI 63066]MCX2680798.1 DUF4258 domain-containing protein [Galbibacter sp. EGI 63066]
MPLLKRIGFFLIGVSIGIVFLAYFFREKRAEFCYLPNCRTLKTIRTQDVVNYSPKMQQLIDNNTVTLEQIDSVLTFGDVNFSKSDIARKRDTKGEKCSTYYIDGNINNKPIELVVENCDTVAEIAQITIK